MIITLLFKEFRLGFRGRDESLSSRIVKNVLTLLGGILFVALLSFLTGALYDKLTAYSYSAPFHTLVFFLFIVLAVTILEGATRARKCLFDKDDSQVIAPLPIARHQVILSKMLYIYLVQLVELALLSMPLLITFGVKVNFPYWYHVMSVVYCLLLSVFSTGLSFLLSLLFQVCLPGLPRPLPRLPFRFGTDGYALDGIRPGPCRHDLLPCPGLFHARPLHGP